MSKIRKLFIKTIYEIGRIECMILSINFIMYKKRYKCFGVRRNFGLGSKNKIEMIFDRKTISKYKKSKNPSFRFMRDANRFVGELEKDVVYTTNTHDIIIKGLEEHKAIEIISIEECKVKSLFFVKLLISNLNDDEDEKVMFYKVKFKVKKPIK